MGCCGHESRSACMPRCRRRCIGTFTNTYKVYEKCCLDVRKVCPCCGYEFDFRRFSMCPHCGGMMDDSPGDPPRFGRFGFGRFGRFGRFGFPFRRRFFPFFSPFAFEPESEEEEEEEFI